MTTVEEEFIAEKNGKPLNLVMEITRYAYEALIQPLLFKTLSCLDDALSDAMLQANQIDKVVLVGGATRTPLVHQLLEERLGRPVHCEIEPDLAVAMGAAVQGGLIARHRRRARSWSTSRPTLWVSAPWASCTVSRRHTVSRRSSRGTRRCPRFEPRSTRRPTTIRKPPKFACFRAKTTTAATTPWSANS